MPDLRADRSSLGSTVAPVPVTAPIRLLGKRGQTSDATVDAHWETGTRAWPRSPGGSSGMVMSGAPLKPRCAPDSACSRACARAEGRGGVGYAAFASAKFGLRAVAQSMARELGPKGIHVAHLIIDAGVDTAWVRERIREQGGEQALRNLAPDQLMNPESIAETYWQLHQQRRDAWTFELEIRPYGESW